MKSFLKILAMILVIIAILAIVTVLVQWANIGGDFSALMSETFIIGDLSIGTVLALAAAFLVVAAILSPKGFQKTMDRVGQGLSTTVGSLTKVVSKTAAGAIGGLFSGLFSGGNLWVILAVAAGVYLLWPDKSEIKERRDAKLRNELEIQKAEAEARIQSEYSKERTSSTINGAVASDIK